MRTKAQRADDRFTRAYYSIERVEWVQRQRSIVSGRRPCVNAHVKNGGKGLKGSYIWIVPLTDIEHKELDGQVHAGGRKTFERKYNIDLLDAARETQERWLLYVMANTREW